MPAILVLAVFSRHIYMIWKISSSEKKLRQGKTMKRGKLKAFGLGVWLQIDAKIVSKWQWRRREQYLSLFIAVMKGGI